MDQEKRQRPRMVASQFDDDEESKDELDQVDPHSQAEILKVYMKQQRVAAPESFERLKEDAEFEASAVGGDTHKRRYNTQQQDEDASMGGTSAYYMSKDSQQDFLGGQITEKTLQKLSSILPSQSRGNSRVGNYQNPQYFSGATGRSNDASLAQHHAADSLRSPWLSQQKSSIPKSSFCLSMSLSASSHDPASGLRSRIARLKQRDKLSEHSSEQCSIICSDQDQLEGSQGQQDMLLSRQDGPGMRERRRFLRVVERSETGENGTSCCISPRMAIDGDENIVVQALLTSDTGSRDSQVNLESVEQDAKPDGSILDTLDENSREKDGHKAMKQQSPVIDDYYARESRIQDFEAELLKTTDKNKHVRTEGTEEAISNEIIGHHLLTASINNNRNATEPAEKIFGLNEPFLLKTIDGTEDENESSQQILSAQSQRNLSRNSSKINQIRSLIEQEHAKTQQHYQRRTLKRMTKPSNSPMLLASAASQSASSPASGGQTNLAANDPHTDNLRHNTAVESLESVSQNKAVKALRSTSTVEILTRENFQVMAVSHVMSDGKPNEDQILFNNYLDTNKQLKFENASSCSLMLSKSGASSSFKDKVRQHFLNNQKLSRDSTSNPLGSFVTSQEGRAAAAHAINQGGTPSNSGLPIATTSSFTANEKVGQHRKDTMLTGPDGQSQVSGHGSILHQFITEGVEEDTVDEECKLPRASGVAVNRLSSLHSTSGQNDEAEHANLKDQFFNESDYLDAAKAIVATGGSCTPNDQTPGIQHSNTAENLQQPHQLDYFSDPLQKVPSTVLTSKTTTGGAGDSTHVAALPSQSRNLTRNNGRSSHINLQTDLAVLDSHSNQEIALQLEAIQSSDGVVRRPVQTPECYGGIFNKDDDAIQRVVSQVRQMETESRGDGTGQHFKFEIERTDSLEFTRNSVTGEHDEEDGDDDDAMPDDMLSGHSQTSSRGINSSSRVQGKARRAKRKRRSRRSSKCHNSIHNQRNQLLDRTKSEVSGRKSEDAPSDHAVNQVVQGDQDDSSHIELIEKVDERVSLGASDRQRKTAPIFSSCHSLTSEHDQDAESLHDLASHQNNEPAILVDSSQKFSSGSQKSSQKHQSQNSSEAEFNNLDQDVDERSVTSSQYNSSSLVNPVQEGSQTASCFKDKLIVQQLDTDTNQTYGNEYSKAGSSTNNLGFGPGNSFPYHELPHASSKVFDEGDMPIPAKFRRQRSSKGALLSTKNQVPQMQRIEARQPDISTISEGDAGMDASSVGAETQEALKRSRVKDHVNRFIRQSQDLGTSLGLIDKSHKSSNLQLGPRSSKEHQYVAHSVKQSIVGRQNHLSPQKVVSVGSDRGGNYQNHNQLWLHEHKQVSSSDKKVPKSELLAAQHRIGIGSSTESRDVDQLPECEILSSYQQPIHGLSSQGQSYIQQNLPGSIGPTRYPQTFVYQQHHRQNLQESADSYKDSHLNMVVASAHHHYETTQHNQHQNQHHYQHQLSSHGAISNNMYNTKKMSYEELLNSELALDAEEIASSMAGEHLNYQSMPQQSIAYVNNAPPEAHLMSSEEYIKYNNEHKHRMPAGSTFEQVIQEFNRQNYFNQLQSPGKCPTGFGGTMDNTLNEPGSSESDNFGQYPVPQPNQNAIFRLPRSQNRSFNASGMMRERTDRDGRCTGELDQSAAEYDCADEVMDGSASQYQDELILQQNRARVGTMNIQKPMLSSQQNKIFAQEKLDNKPKEKPQNKKTTSTLKKLLFAGPIVSKPLQEGPQTTRNAVPAPDMLLYQHQQPATSDQDPLPRARNHSASSKTVPQKVPSRNPSTKTYLTSDQLNKASSAQKVNKNALPLSPHRKPSKNFKDFPSSIQNTPTDKQNPLATITRTNSLQKQSQMSSPHSEYQISKKLVFPQSAQNNFLPEEQSEDEQYYDHYGQAISGGKQQQNAVMSTIVESLISIDNQQQASYQDTQNQSNQNQAPFIGSAEQLHQNYGQMDQTNQTAAKNFTDKYHTNSIWPSSIKKDKSLSRLHQPMLGRNQTAQNDFRQIQSMHHLLQNSDKKMTNTLLSSHQLTERSSNFQYCDQNPTTHGGVTTTTYQQMASGQEQNQRMHYDCLSGGDVSAKNNLQQQYYSNNQQILKHQKATMHSNKKQVKKQANRTMLSLNSSRQPTTKNQLESQFLQRSQSNGSSATRKPFHSGFPAEENLIRDEGRAFQTELHTQRRHIERQHLVQVTPDHLQSHNLIDVHDQQQTTPRKVFKQGQERSPQYLTQPQDKTEQTTSKHTYQRQVPQILLHNPITDVTCPEEQLCNELDFEGRGFTDSQQLSLDSDMHHFFGDEQRYQHPGQEMMMQPIDAHQRQYLQQQMQNDGRQPKQTDSSILPLIKQQTSLMFRTEANLQQSEATGSIGKPCPTCRNHSHAKDGLPSSGLTNQSSILMRTTNSDQMDQSIRTKQLQHKSSSERDRANAMSETVDRRRKGRGSNGAATTKGAFQKAIKMTKYLMSEIERLQRNNQQTAGLVVNENVMTEILKQNFSVDTSEEDQEEEKKDEANDSSELQFDTNVPKQ